MEAKGHVVFVVEDENSSEQLPTLLQNLSTNELNGFDTASDEDIVDGRKEEYGSQTSSSSADMETRHGLKVQTNRLQPQHQTHHHKKHSVSISMPSSPSKVVEPNHKRVIFSIGSEGVFNNALVLDSCDDDGYSNEEMKQIKYYSYSQPIAKGSVYSQPEKLRKFRSNHANSKKLKDHRYDSFKTWSGKLERQITNLRLGARGVEPENNCSEHTSDKNMPVDRYFAALEGPELDTLRDSEEIVLPEDKTWPFLLRFPISSFGICLGVSSQAIMWKTLATSEATKFLNISPIINVILWFIALFLVIIVASIYLLKIILFFEAVRREYYHPIRVNFFFAPWIALLFLALGVPPCIATKLPHTLWYVLMVPFLILEVKIYGQWMSGGQRRLSKVANPSNHLSVVGNFVGSLLGASMGLTEGPIFFFSVGLAHYMVLFVTLYQRLPTNATLPKELHPVFFLFVAAPSVASMAWAKINGSFDFGARIPYFIALFLYFSLAVRVNFFRGFKFSLAWWAYTFPMTGAAIATIKYSSEVDNVVTQALCVVLSSISTLTVTALLVSTIIHAFVFRDLFPNDIAIAISERRPIQNRWFQTLRPAGSAENIENFLKFVNSNEQDIEARVVSGTDNSKV